jgi:hypothetical protein
LTLMNLRPTVSWTLLAFLPLAVSACHGVVGQDPLTDPQRHTANTGSGPAKLAEFWRGDARWDLYQRLPGETAQHVEVVDGIWYGFSRTLPAPIAGCSITCGTAVRVSKDKGRTWSAPTTVLPPTPGSAYACCATDGDTYYDRQKQEWTYIFQCMGKDGHWNGCVARRQGSSPVGLFSPAGIPNPVIKGGSLWGQICDKPSDDCVRISGGVGKVYDEGTFHFIERRGEHYYVTMHGYDGVHGYAGIARSADLIHWEAGDPAHGTPADAIFDRDDANTWRESWVGGTSIGGGLSSIVIEDGHYYMTVESADMNLGCTPGQNWDVGLLRSSSLTNTHWEGLPAGNPFYYSSHRPEALLPDGTMGSNPCNIQYTSFFQDDVTRKWYMAGARMTSKKEPVLIYVYELSRLDDRLDNGNLWKCRTEGWSRRGTPSFAVYRDPSRSADYTCFMELNCGNDGCVGDSIYQDAAASGLQGRRMRFGADLAHNSGAGRADLVVHQLGSSGQIVTSTNVQCNLGQSYQSFSGAFVVRQETRTLRFEIYLSSAGNYQADRMFLAPEETPSNPAPGPAPGPAPEAAPVESYLRELYTSVYHRNADTPGLQYWAQQYSSGAIRCVDMTRAFLVSPEAKTLQASLSTTAFVAYLYPAAFGRPGDTAGMAYWNSELQSGSTTRGGVIEHFAAHAEVKSRCTHAGLAP